MSFYCPKDGKICIDDLCRGCGNCILGGGDMLDRCHACGGWVGTDFDSCTCDPPEPYEDDPFDNTEYS